MTAEHDASDGAELRTEDEFTAPAPVDLAGALGENPNADVDPVAAAAALGSVPWEAGSAKPDPILVCENVSRRFGGLLAVDVEHLEIQRGVITALIGPNGAGKTTFFNLLTNFDTPDTGSRTFFPDRVDDTGPAPVPEFAYAGFGARIGAQLIDAVLYRLLVLLVPLSVLLIGLLINFVFDGWRFASYLVTAIVALAALLAVATPIAFISWLITRTAQTGQSPGGSALGTYLVDAETGRRISGRRVFGRALAKILSALPLFLGYFWALWDPRRQTWHDKLAKTVVLSDLPPPTNRKIPPIDLNGVPTHKVAAMGMVRTFQLTKALSRMTCIENMKLGATGQAGESLFASWLPFAWRDQEREIEGRADALLGRFKMDHMRDQFAGTLSGGQRKLLEMARALMVRPKLVMLDEPMAGVNPALTQSLLGHITGLRDSGMTVVFVEHDMDMVQSIADWVVVMAEGRIIAEGPPASIAANQAVVDAYLGSSHDSALDLNKEL